MTNDGVKLSDLLAQLAGGRPDRKTALLVAARQGKVEQVEQYCRAHKHCTHLADDKYGLIDSLIQEPQAFRAKQRLFETLTDTGFDFQKFFLMRHQSLSLGNVFTMYKTDPTPETRRVAAVLSAEYIRTRVLIDLRHKIDVTDLFNNVEGAKGSLREAAAQASTRDTIIAVQNALVDYVREEAPQLPLNRGAALLSLLADDIAEQGGKETVRFWNDKITNLQEGMRYHILTGDVKHIRPTFDAR